MSALAKSPVADALREAGLTEEQIKAALDAAAKQPIKSALTEAVDKAKSLGLSPEICISGSTGDEWLNVEVIDSGERIGSLGFWPSHGGRWTLNLSCTPDAAPSPMARAQRLYDLYRQLVAS